jgi:hypothetical protein
MQVPRELTLGHVFEQLKLQGSKEGESAFVNKKMEERLDEHGVATVQREGVGELLQSLRLDRVPRVSDPAVRLHQHGGTEVLVLIPPVRRARSRAARAEDALVHAVELEAVRLGLKVLATVGGDGGLEVGLNRLVLLVELGHVGNEVLDDVH